MKINYSKMFFLLPLLSILGYIFSICVDIIFERIFLYSAAIQFSYFKKKQLAEDYQADILT